MKIIQFSFKGNMATRGALTVRFQEADQPLPPPVRVHPTHRLIGPGSYKRRHLSGSTCVLGRRSYFGGSHTRPYGPRSRDKCLYCPPCDELACRNVSCTQLEDLLLECYDTAYLLNMTGDPQLAASGPEQTRGVCFYPGIS